MGYVTVAQLRVALAPSVVDGANPPNPKSQTAADLPNSQLQDAIDEGSSIVDAAIGGRYLTPVAPSDPASPTVFPHPVDFWARNIAAYLATCTYRGSVDFTDNDPIYRRYKTTLDSLTDVKNGIGTLAIAPVASGTGAVGAGKAVNLYLGHLFDACDFDLRPAPLLGVPRWQDELPNP